MAPHDYCRQTSSTLGRDCCATKFCSHQMDSLLLSRGLGLVPYEKDKTIHHNIRFESRTEYHCAVGTFCNFLLKYFLLAHFNILPSRNIVLTVQTELHFIILLNCRLHEVRKCHFNSSVWTGVPQVLAHAQVFVNWFITQS